MSFWYHCIYQVTPTYTCMCRNISINMHGCVVRTRECSAACFKLFKLKGECTLLPSSGLPISRTSGIAGNFPFRFSPGCVASMIYSHYQHEHLVQIWPLNQSIFANEMKFLFGHFNKNIRHEFIGFAQICAKLLLCASCFPYKNVLYAISIQNLSWNEGHLVSGSNRMTRTQHTGLGTFF